MEVSLAHFESKSFSLKNQNLMKIFIFNSDGSAKLGPGQIRPKGHRGLLSHGEVKLGLLMTKGQLEVEVVCARNIIGTSKDMPPGKSFHLKNFN